MQETYPAIDALPADVRTDKELRATCKAAVIVVKEHALTRDKPQAKRQAQAQATKAAGPSGEQRDTVKGATTPGGAARAEAQNTAGVHKQQLPCSCAQAGPRSAM